MEGYSFEVRTPFLCWYALSHAREGHKGWAFFPVMRGQGLVREPLKLSVTAPWSPVPPLRWWSSPTSAWL